MSEHDEQVALFNILALYTNKYPILKWVFAIPNGQMRKKAIAANLKREGVRAGVWDIFVPVVRHGTGGMFIEMKFGKNKLTENQMDFLEVIKVDYHFSVCYSAVEAAHAIGEYLNIPELKEIE